MAVSVQLIDYTGKDSLDSLYAARMLVFSKSTRLNMTPMLLQAVGQMPVEEVYKELDYMSKTIPSSWEFVDLTFLISDVSRACAQQITRTRNASFAMQSQRVTDISSATYLVPNDESFDDESNALYYQSCMDDAIYNYKSALDRGISLENARNLLPIGIHCNLLAKYNLRAFVDLVRKRQSLRVQDEYRDVITQMLDCTMDIWPWVHNFTRPKKYASIELIEEVASTANLTDEQKRNLAKAADLLKVE